jgi:hypothetical protein
MTPEELRAQMITAEAYSGELYPDRHTIECWRHGVEALSKRLETLENLIADGPVPDDRVSTHWDGCWREHVWCYVSRLREAAKP